MRFFESVMRRHACGGRMVVGAVVAAALMGGTAWGSDNWIKPTAEELKMTELPGHPGVPAVVLNREEITKDDLHVNQHYERIKILTEKGKAEANVELRFASSHGDGFYEGDDKNITDISGRTIHPDGTIIPFTGKPFLKTMQKNSEYSYQARVFTLPDVEVGSIIEYRYSTRIADNIFEAPDWYIQGELYIKNAHYAWYPTTHELSSEEGTVSTIAWFPILPAGVTVQRTETPRASTQGGYGPQQTIQVTVHDIAPQEEEEHMPPIASFSYRVLFYYTAFRTSGDFWKSAGKKWSKRFDNFAGPDNALSAATQTLIAGASTQDARLRKIYAEVMRLENTDYTRSHERTEDKAAGLGKLSSAADVLKQERGSGTQLTQLFVGMARAAGMKAYAMLVPDRENHLFSPGYLSLYQLDDVVAIVVVDGKEQFFDPASRYCAYGHLSWQDTYVTGLRQTEGGTDFARTPGDIYKDAKTDRVGDLTADDHGEVSGKVTLTYTGSPALVWRQRALRGDEESVKHGFRTALEEMVPKSLEVTVESIDDLREYEKPLVVHFRVKGGVGTATGKRLILPADIFVADERTEFPHEKREQPVYFHYAQMMLDAVRIKYPATLAVEAAPADARGAFQTLGSYSLSSAPGTNSITVRRSFLFNTVIVPTKDYGELRTFYTTMETKDKDSIVLKAAPPSATPASAAPAGN